MGKLSSLIIAVVFAISFVGLGMVQANELNTDSSTIILVKGKAGEDHGKAGEDHGKAGDDHGKAGGDHGKSQDSKGKKKGHDKKDH